MAEACIAKPTDLGRLCEVIQIYRDATKQYIETLLNESIEAACGLGDTDDPLSIPRQPYLEGVKNSFDRV